MFTGRSGVKYFCLFLLAVVRVSISLLCLLVEAGNARPRGELWPSYVKWSSICLAGEGN